MGKPSGDYIDYSERTHIFGGVFLDEGALTIASGAVTIKPSPKDRRAAYTVAVESSTTDDLDTINGGATGQMLVLRPVDDTKDIVIKHATGNIECPGAADITLAEDDDCAILYSNGTKWTVVAYKCKASSGGGLGSLLASTATSKGASLIGIEDAAGKITATNVETALAEIAADGWVTAARLGTAAVTKANAKLFITANATEHTGTGSAQNIAHGLGTTPTGVLIVPTELDGNAYDCAEGSHDSTNVVVTVTSGAKFKVLAWA